MPAERAHAGTSVNTTPVHNDSTGPAQPSSRHTARPAQPSSRQPTPFKRTLGEYPLRSRAPAALLALRARTDKPVWGRGTGCAFA
eukprot:288953-Pleurochrysis_carterae.AAC.1